jgi:hypothetical protein
MIRRPERRRRSYRSEGVMFQGAAAKPDPKPQCPIDPDALANALCSIATALGELAESLRSGQK